MISQNLRDTSREISGVVGAINHFQNFKWEDHFDAQDAGSKNVLAYLKALNAITTISDYVELGLLPEHYRHISDSLRESLEMAYEHAGSQMVMGTAAEVVLV